MTKEEWQLVKEKLSSVFGRAELKIDGYAVTLEVRRIKPLKYAIMVFVDGVSKGEWCLGEAEESKRFCRPVTRALHSPARKRAALKGLRSKAEIKRISDLLGLDKTWTYWDLCWPTFEPLKRHLIANNQSIELVQEEVAS